MRASLGSVGRRVMVVRWMMGWNEREREPGAQSRERRFERVASEGVGVFARLDALTETEDRGAEDRGHQDACDHIRMRSGREVTGVDRGLDLGAEDAFHLTHESESLPVLVDARDGAIDEHERKVFRVRSAELVDTPERLANRRHRIGLLTVAQLGRRGEEDVEPFLRERVEDVVLAREVAVDGRWAVLDALGDLADRDVVVPLGDEQGARRIEDRPCDRLALPLLTFFDSQKSPRKRVLNSVQHINTVIRPNASQSSSALGVRPQATSAGPLGEPLNQLNGVRPQWF